MTSCAFSTDAYAFMGGSRENWAFHAKTDYTTACDFCGLAKSLFTLRSLMNVHLPLREKKTKSEYLNVGALLDFLSVTQ